MPPTLPIEACLPELLQSITRTGHAVLQAPPGAGKTTRVPLALLGSGQISGKILMLEPRRLAARAAAERMAQNLAEPVGNTVGYRVRGDAKVSQSTRIEVVTEGILTRMIQSDPALTDISAVIFDEFHERSLNADLGRALCLEIREALRDDLLLLVMSATLDAAPVAELMGGAPIITSSGRAFPVQTHWLDRPPVPKSQYEQNIARLVERAAAQADGGILVFLPGEREIRATAATLNLPDDCIVQPLFGAMPFKDQQAAIQPLKNGRKVVLATSIAETSLTIQDIRTVVDGGRSRRARFDPGSGMSRLVTERVTKAEAEQRRGRAGRIAEGVCYRHWTKGEDGGLSPYLPAEVEAADLTGLVLELALWGAAKPDALPFLTQPNPGGYAEAQLLLRTLGALDDQMRITGHGRALARLPLHPRLAHMLVTAGPGAANIAALMADHDPLRTREVDLGLRLDAIANPKGFARNRDLLVKGADRISAEARRLRKFTSQPSSAFSPAQIAALAYPDRVGLRRKGDAPRWVLSGGKGAKMDADDPMAGQRLIVATDLDGDAREARIRLALPISEADLRDLYGDQIVWHNIAEWSKRQRRVSARQQEQYGSLTLSDRLWHDAPADQIAMAALDGIRDIGLPTTPSSVRFMSRVELVRAGGDALPDMTIMHLMETLETWLQPHIPTLRTEVELRNFDILPALRAMLDWSQMQHLDQLAPASFETPLGRKIPISYETDIPTIDVRLQEMFGVTQHPNVGPDKQPIRIALLSPAQRPVQVTTDLPGFWASSYADVRKDMRGRYPKHPWPEDPTKADPTLKAKRRN